MQHGLLPYVSTSYLFTFLLTYLHIFIYTFSPTYLPFLFFSLLYNLLIYLPTYQLHIANLPIHPLTYLSLATKCNHYVEPLCLTIKFNH
jgi:hypothetical protein